MSAVGTVPARACRSFGRHVHRDPYTYADQRGPGPSVYSCRQTPHHRLRAARARPDGVRGCRSAGHGARSVAPRHELAARPGDGPAPDPRRGRHTLLAAAAATHLDGGGDVTDAERHLRRGPPDRVLRGRTGNRGTAGSASSHRRTDRAPEGGRRIGRRPERDRPGPALPHRLVGEHRGGRLHADRDTRHRHHTRLRHPRHGGEAPPGHHRRTPGGTPRARPRPA